ncbi:oxidoreductase [Legionella lansingensis]|uniref:Oxidoreductase n=1 Tax=Legionella lansingensis TaxID=45067 RepID=A0A0W0VU06_9GAMM|nr:SDR family oxidoreductase [Legionella lansingensis]KTD23562.1 oxidoreductase [Legionella lansingensis]SNV52251.1 oxidoreductase [Legionella lansingensis]
MKTILITGSNRGLGFEFVKQLSQQDTQIIATCRNPDKASDLQHYAKIRRNIAIYQLDVTNDKEIKQLERTLNHLALDWIINNAGISGESGVTVGNIERENFLNVMNVNCLSPLKVSEGFLPLLLKGKDKLVINISSSMGSIGENQRGRSYAYRASKTALNCVMRSFALDVAEDGVNIMLLHPGWVKTGIGGPDAEMDVKASVQAMLAVIEKYHKNSHAEALRSYDGQLIPW